MRCDERRQLTEGLDKRETGGGWDLGRRRSWGGSRIGQLVVVAVAAEAAAAGHSQREQGWLARGHDCGGARLWWRVRA